MIYLKVPDKFLSRQRIFDAIFEEEVMRALEKPPDANGCWIPYEDRETQLRRRQRIREQIEADHSAREDSRTLASYGPQFD